MNRSAVSTIDPEIRLALPTDSFSIARVLAESFAVYQPVYTPKAFAATTPGRDQIEQRLQEGPVWVAVRHGGVVGTVSVVARGNALTIRSLAVHPAANGQRLGEMLVRQVEQYALEQGFQRLSLSTTPFLTGAIRLYEHMGFQRSRRQNQ